MKGNLNIEQRGTLGKTLPQNVTTTLPVISQQRCNFRINTYYYLSTNENIQKFNKGLVWLYLHHERQTVLFSIHTDMDKNMEKMVKQFAMTNYSPATCVQILHRMDDRLYDAQTVANIFNKAKKSILE
jgi:hypothetical protein